MSPAAVLLVALLLQVEPTSAHLGQLEIHSLPGTEVVWEGVPIGRTNDNGWLGIGGIPPGIYAVELRKDGHAPARAEVEVAPPGRAFLRLPLAEDARSLAKNGVPGPPPTGEASPVNAPEVNTAAVLVASLAAVLLLASWRLARRRAPAGTPASSVFPPVGLVPDDALPDDGVPDDGPTADDGVLVRRDEEPMPSADFLTELRRRERVLAPSQDDVLDADVLEIGEEL